VAAVDGGELLVRMLERAGIREIFTLHGGHLDAIYQAARERDFRLIDTRHEQAAAHAADGWARTTGKLGVVVVTAGPGVTDAVTGVANAFLDCIPMLVVGGAAPLRDAETLPLQGGFDQLALLEPITKWAHRVTHTARIPDLVAQALRVASTGRPGPVYLEVPIDVLFARVEEERVFFPEELRPRGAPAPSAEAVAQALDWLEAAERPVILAGGGAWFSGAGPELRAFAERVRVPVFSNGKAHGLVPADHPLCGRGFANLAVLRHTGAGEPDLVMLLGARLGLFTGGRSTDMIPAAARLIQVDVEGEEIGRNRDIALGIVADCREALRALDAEASGRRWRDRESWLAAVRQASGAHRLLFAQALEREKPPIHPYQLADAVRRTVDRDAVLVADGGETAAWMEMVAEVRFGGHWLSHGYLGCLGTGMPFAIAAKAAHPDRQVVCIVGDGSVGLNFAEFDTMVRHGLPIVVVVANDQQWGMSAHGQDLIYGKGRRVVTDLAPTRYDLAAGGFGCHAEHVVDPADLVPALRRALESGRPACVNVMTDPSVIAPVTLAMVGSASAGPRESEKKAAKKSIPLPYYENLEE
jgi:acetolactate synthase-1/2/3 large subunit